MRTTITATLCLMLFGVVQAQNPVRVGERERTAVKVRRASAIMGTSLTVRGGTTLGKVVDIVINEHGCIDYLVIRYGSEFVPIPWGVVTYDTTARGITVNVNVTRDQLRTITFREGNWPDFSSQQWMRNARSIWGEKAFRQERRDIRRDDRFDRRDDRRDRRDDRRDRRDDRRDDRDDRRDDRRDNPPPKPLPKPRPPVPPDRDNN